MKPTLIWDLDGTIIDSYPIIIESIIKAASENGISLIPSDIELFVKERSVNSFLEQLAQTLHVDFMSLKKRYSEINSANDHRVMAMNDAHRVFELIAGMGIDSYIFTHKGKLTHQLLHRLGIDKNFVEIVTSANGFKRKPDPEAILYLIDKYKLDKQNVYYVGDRDIDIDCAKNAKIKSIAIDSKYIKEKADYVISSFSEIVDLLQNEILKRNQEE